MRRFRTRVKTRKLIETRELKEPPLPEREGTGVRVQTKTNLPLKRVDVSTPKKKIREKNTYLRVGDKVYHKNFRSWGGGLVIETWSSELPGGMCYVQILFQDGKKRIFDNSLESTCCCCYAGITLLNRTEL